MITFHHKGDFKKTISHLNKIRNFTNSDVFDKYGKMGVEALRNATPKHTSKTSESWYYNILRKSDSVIIEWCNSNTNRNVNIAVIIQYGHATKKGTFVQGIDYVNPAMKPIFEQLSIDLWKEVTG